MWSQDFAEFIGLLNDRGVDYLIVGGHAVGIHGHPRYTGDLDVWVAPIAGNAARLLQVFDAFGFGNLGISADDFTQEGRVLQLGQPPFRIDVLTSIDGVSFAEADARRIEVEYHGLPIRIIGRSDLLRNKHASGRLKDLADIEALGDSGR